MTKRLISLGAVSAAVWLLSACQTVAPKETKSPASEPSPREVFVPVVRQPDHSILHPASGMKFPEQVGEFKRQGYRQTGPRGFNFSCDYKFTGLLSPILATVSIYPAPSVTAAGQSDGLIREARPGMASSEYQAEVKRILTEHPQAVVTSERGISLAQGPQERTGRYVEFEFEDTIAGRRQPVTLRLYLFNDADEKWAVKFRVMYPKGFPAEKLISTFLADLHWTIKDA